MRLPHPLVLLLGCVVVAVTLTWILPAGQYDRIVDEATGRNVVVPGTYRVVDPAPLGIMAALMAVPQGIVDGADIILTILFVGGAFALLERTGALARLVGAIVGKARRPRLLVAAVCLAFGTLGALENMHEEIVAMVPVLLVLSRGLGFGPVTALAMSIGSAVVGAAFGPTNPFQTGIALKIAQLPAMSQPGLRFSLFATAMVVWIGWTLWMTSRDAVEPHDETTGPAPAAATVRDGVLLMLVLLPFVPYVIGVLQFDWGFNELSGLFLVAAFAIGAVSGRTLSETSTDFLKAMETMLAAALFVGVARGISIAMQDGLILDTILHGLVAPLEAVPAFLAAFLMVPIHTLLHFAVPSVSGQAVLTMPIMAPLADLLGLSRDAVVIAYQTGAGLSDMLIPTNGALLAMLLAAQVPFSRWLRFAVPGSLLVAMVGLIGIVLAG